MLLHSLFDALALAASILVYRLLPVPGAAIATPWRAHRSYVSTASLGATLGAYLFGSLNLWLTGIDGFGRSIEGALAGAVVAIELLKRHAGIAGSTGVRLAVPLAVAIAVGRIGCYLAGLDDMTYGTPTSLPWGVDFGDGIPRHPVQLYESATMACFAIGLAILIRRGNALAVRAGFYLFVGTYAAQRFVWEFLKPYGTVAGPFNLFHLLSAALVAYAFVFTRQEMPGPWRSHPSSPRG
jgi:prolipoprotein diacylglyceryltransferase